MPLYCPGCGSSAEEEEAGVGMRRVRCLGQPACAAGPAYRASYLQYLWDRKEFLESWDKRIPWIRTVPKGFIAFELQGIPGELKRLGHLPKGA